MAVGPSGAVYMASRTLGNTLSNGATVTNTNPLGDRYDWALTKVSAAGAVVWHVHLPGGAYNSGMDDQITGLIVTASEEILVSGQHGANASPTDAEKPFSGPKTGATAVDFVGKLTAAGAVVWWTQLTKSSPAFGWSAPDALSDFSTALVPGPGGYYLGGYSHFRNTSVTAAWTPSLDAFYVKSFAAPAGGAAPPASVAVTTFLTSWSVLPSSFFSGNTVPAASYLTGLAVDSRAMYICGCARYRLSVAIMPLRRRGHIRVDKKAELHARR